MLSQATGDGSLQMGDAVALIKGKSKNLRRKEKRARIEQIRASLGLSDSQRTPTVLLYLYGCVYMYIYRFQSLVLQQKL